MICFAFPLAHEAGLVLKRCTEKESFTIDGVHLTLANFRTRRVLIAQSLYAFGALLCVVSNYASIALIVLVQLNYAIAPRRGRRLG